MNKEDAILVTGAAGLIGSAVVWELNRRGFENIVIAEILGSDEKWRNLVPLKYASYIDANELLENPDAPPTRDVRCIFHLGACSATTEKDADYLMRNNYAFTMQLARWALAEKLRFVYASSAATYGDGSAGMSDRDPDQLHALRPLNMYGYSKHLVDLHAHRNGWLTKITGLKYFNVFGPNEDHKGGMRSVVHKAFHEISSTGKVSLFRSHHPDYPDGGQMRDFLYVKNAAAVTVDLALNPGATGIFNVGSGIASTWIDLVTPIFAALGLPVAIDFVDMPEQLRGRYQYHTRADISRLLQHGVAATFTPLAEAVHDYVSHYLQFDRRLGDLPES